MQEREVVGRTTRATATSGRRGGIFLDALPDQLEGASRVDGGGGDVRLCNSSRVPSPGFAKKMLLGVVLQDPLQDWISATLVFGPRRSDFLIRSDQVLAALDEFVVASRIADY